MNKEYLPIRAERYGGKPETVLLKGVRISKTACVESLIATRTTAHFFLDADGSVTSLTPLSLAATALKAQSDISPKTGILIYVRTESGGLFHAQKEPLIRLLRRIQRETVRIYGESIPFGRSALKTRDLAPNIEELLEEAELPIRNQPLYRVQVGCYADRKSAEDAVERLRKEGIASYIAKTEIWE